MSQADDFLAALEPYRTKAGLIDAHTLPVPKPVDWGDNGTMFYGESICILVSLLDDPKDKQKYLWRFTETLAPYFIVPGLLRRRRDSDDVDGPDNMLGVLAASRMLGEPHLARYIFWYGIEHLGFFNQPNPGNFTMPHKVPEVNWEAFLWRQPQLIAAALSAGRFPWILRFLFTPVYFYAALVILYSGLRRKPNNEDMDSRRLAWLLIQCVKDTSILCLLASKVWYHGLRKDFPLEKWGQSMRGVASQYYEAGHPFIKYWKD